MGFIIKEGEYKIKVSINQVDLEYGELVDFIANYELGNKMAWCDISIKTKRKDVYRQCLFEMSIIEVELHSIDKNNSTIDKQKMRYFLAKNSIQMFTDGNHQVYDIKVIGVADAWMYMGYPMTQSAKKRETSSPRFLSELKYWKDQGKKGTGSMKIEIKDGLKSKATDWQYWLQTEVTGQELVNQILLRPILKTNKNKLGGSREYVPTANVEFTDSGDPKIVFYDLKLRTQSFEPKSCLIPAKDGNGAMGVPMFFSFKQGDEGKVAYSSLALDIKGADYSAMYWQRTAMVYDVEEGEFIARRIKQPKLFGDSMKYGTQQVFNGQGGNIPSKYTLFTNYERWNMEWYNTNHYNQHYALQKFQITANLLALRKVNVTMYFRNKFIKAKPIDICRVEVQEGSLGEPKAVDSKLSGKYMITKVAYGVKDYQLFTMITASRDSFVS